MEVQNQTSLLDYGVSSLDVNTKKKLDFEQRSFLKMMFPCECPAGFCVAEPYNFRASKRFFVDLKLPHSVARNEQVEIKAVVHNYGFEDLDVRESPSSRHLREL